MGYKIVHHMKSMGLTGCHSVTEQASLLIGGIKMAVSGYGWRVYPVAQFSMRNSVIRHWSLDSYRSMKESCDSHIFCNHSLKNIPIESILGERACNYDRTGQATPATCCVSHSAMENLRGASNYAIEPASCVASGKSSATENFHATIASVQGQENVSTKTDLLRLLKHRRHPLVLDTGSHSPSYQTLALRRAQRRQIRYHINPVRHRYSRRQM